MFTTGRRTRVKPGHEAHYAAVHAQIPEPVHTLLRGCGVVRWYIWSDGGSLFHSIDTVAGYDEMLKAIAKIGPVDPEWDAVIRSLLDSEPDSDRILSLVWSMDPEGQHPGASGSESAVSITSSGRRLLR